MTRGGVVVSISGVVVGAVSSTIYQTRFHQCPQGGILRTFPHRTVPASRERREKIII